jgi:crotonobetainyl-CoA:carnitine CoA-transferase CaiB-like acyl-CoA transferase
MASGAWANACDIQAKLCNAVFPERTPGGHPPNPLTAVYQSRDKKLFLLVLIDPGNEFPRLCAAFGQPELADGELFSTNAARAENAAALYAILQSQFDSTDLAEWRTTFKQNDIKWAPLPKLDDVIADPQLRASGAIVEFEGDRLETVNSPVFITGIEKTKPRTAPEIGAHTLEVLRDIGYGDGEIETLIRDGAVKAAL